MSKRNWHAVAATLGFVVVVLAVGTLLAWVLWPGSSNLPGYEWEKTAYSEYKAGGASCEPSAINRLPTEPERASKRDVCEEAQERHRIDINDLKQQTRAADAARAVVIVAEWQAKATVFGLIVGFYTLAAAVAAAWFAKRAADAAEGGLLHSKDLALAQVRPYVVPGRPAITKRLGDWWDIDLPVRNVGPIPAFNVEVDVEADLLDIPSGPPPTYFNKELEPFAIVVPTSKTDATASVSICLVEDVLASIRAANKGVLFRVRISYIPYVSAEKEEALYSFVLVGSDLDDSCLRIAPQWFYDGVDSDEQTSLDLTTEQQDNSKEKYSSSLSERQGTIQTVAFRMMAPVTA